MLETKGCCQCDGTQVDPRVAELEQVIKEYRGMEGALIMILHKAQEIYGYLPEHVQRTVAKALEIPLTDVYGVATFYSYFSLTPLGKYRIAVCMGTACYVRGAGELLSAFERELGVKSGETTADMGFTLQASRCIGACGLAPVLTVNEDVYGSVTADKVGEILKKYRS